VKGFGGGDASDRDAQRRDGSDNDDIERERAGWYFARRSMRARRLSFGRGDLPSGNLSGWN
jgi:hypothetical protein